MSRYQVDKLLRDLRRDKSLAERFRDDIDSVLGAYQLDETERDLLRRWEVRDLYDRGVNPLLLLLGHMTSGRSLKDYAALMNSRNRPEGG